MNQPIPLLAALAEHTQNAAAHLAKATEERSRALVAEISDINRQVLSDLADAERHAYRNRGTPPIGMASAYRLANCVHRAFSAAMLLPEDLPFLPPLCEITACHLALAEYPARLLRGAHVDFFSMHLAANKGRGAHAVLLMNYCSTPGGGRLIPLALALEAHRNVLELACEQLLLETTQACKFEKP